MYRDHHRLLLFSSSVLNSQFSILNSHSIRSSLVREGCRIESSEVMGDLCISEEISEIPSTVEHVSSDYYPMKRHGYVGQQMVYCDARRNTSLRLNYFGSYSIVDGIFARLLTSTAYISHRLIHFIEDLVLGDISRCSEDPRSSSLNISRSDLESSLLHCKPCSDDSSAETCESRVLELGKEFVVNIRSEVVENHNRDQGIPFIFQGLMLPLFGLRLACKLGLASWRCTFSHVRCAQLQIRSVKSRLQRTLRGSSDDIGWLQRAPGMPPVEEGTPRFLEILASIRNGEHSLPDSFVYLLIPGLFSNHGPLYFVETKRFFSKMGLACHIAKIHSEASVEHNAWELKQYIEEHYWGSGKRVILLGHSKGGIDAAAALSIYWSDLKDKVAGLALVQSPYGGTPLASDVLREGQIADREARRIMELLICKLIKGDMRALEDLTYEKRKEFIMNHKLPEDIPIISFHSEASTAPGVLATMTQIAHAELPRLPLPAFGSEEPGNSVQAGHQVPVIVPLSAAMAACALHLQLRYGEKSDGLVTGRDAEVPGSVVVKPDRKLDHAWMVYSSRNNSSNNNNEPDACEMCEAILTFLVELGKKKEEETAQPQAS